MGRIRTTAKLKTICKQAGPEQVGGIVFAIGYSSSVTFSGSYVSIKFSSNNFCLFVSVCIEWAWPSLILACSLKILLIKVFCYILQYPIISFLSEEFLIIHNSYSVKGMETGKAKFCIPIPFQLIRFFWPF